MICSSCVHSVMQKVKDKDMIERELVYCDLIGWHIDRLVECSRYQEMKSEIMKEHVPIESTISGGMISEFSREIKKKGWPKGKKRIKKSGVSG